MARTCEAGFRRGIFSLAGAGCDASLLPVLVLKPRVIAVNWSNGRLRIITQGYERLGRLALFYIVMTCTMDLVPDIGVEMGGAPFPLPRLVDHLGLEKPWVLGVEPAYSCLRPASRANGKVANCAILGAR